MLNEESEDPANADLGQTILKFKKIAENPVSRLILKNTLTYCEKDQTNRLEAALEIYLDKRDDYCWKCYLTSKIIGYIVSQGSKSFGVEEKEFKEYMEDEYWIKGLYSVLKGIGVFGVEKPFIPGAPFQVVWNITHACNMSCLHCYENAGKKEKDELRKEDVYKGLDILAKAGVTSLAFSGGEPSIHPHILDFISYAKEKGMYVAMATNGYIFSDKNYCEKFVEAGLEFIQISIDGMNPNTHDSFRRRDGAWDRAINAAKNFAKNDVFLEVATTVTERNLNEIPDMINYIGKLGADWFMLYNFIPTGNGSENSEMDISPLERFKILEMAYDKNYDGEMQILSTAPQYAMIADNLNKNENIIPTHFYNPEYSNPTIAQLAEFIGGCGAGRFYLSIEPNGDIYPCVFFPHEKDLKLGNILQDDFESLWRDNEILEKLRDKSLLKGHCGACESRNICGGCRARAYSYFNDILAPDPGCINNKKEWNKIKTELTCEEYQKLHEQLKIHSK